jgi:type II secretory pathway pseudopilin PulG
MSEQPQQTQEGPPPAPTVNGKALAIFIVVGTIVLGVFTYYGVPQFVNPYFRAKPAQAEEFLDRIAAAINAYRVDHGTFPPVEELNHFRRQNKNLMRSRSYGIYSYRMTSLTTPTAYIDPNRSGDPYAMPDQTCPAAYFVMEFDGKSVALVYSPGPNLKYNVRPPTLRSLQSRQALDDYLKTMQYDPSNGTRSGGDLWRLVE